jgi:Glycosyltransferases, probably involved in cell wall biogenesis
MKYAIITAARNEERVIRQTLESVTAQTRVPVCWVIADDGSSDRTASIVEEYSTRHDWIELIRLPQRNGRNFAGKVHAFNAALEQLAPRLPDVIVNLDSDVSFEPGYMEFLLRKFAEDPKLGIAGTPFTQEGGYDSTKDSFEGENYVAGPCQLFRAECLRDVGGYVPNPAGGVDWIAVMTARVKGWTVRAFPEKRFHHHRPMGTAGRGQLAALFSYGKKDYYLGGSPVWEPFRAAYRMTKRPLLVGGMALLLGYCWAAVRRIERPVTPEIVQFHRREQMKKLRAVLASVLRFRKLDAFRVATESDGR